ncbi:hypothetical protein BGE01nite_56640 [Brevifollis gellanilyticus]|uniref:Uncharacterized protein n=1 Tax=Brevifollis gellanilyticus TaxID=748831 RepID=A0A512MI13_9BACT|nr:hypothetical protein BGE01nite_56640 [Brevifollis gellanilyticus]
MAPYFIPFILLSAAVLVISGTIIATPETLSLTNMFGRFELPWREVDRIEFGQGSLVFFAGQRRLTLPVFGWWSGPDAYALYNLIHSFSCHGQIPMKLTFRADLLLHKNTRVSC